MFLYRCNYVSVGQTTPAAHLYMGVIGLKSRSVEIAANGELLATAGRLKYARYDVKGRFN